ncbi:E3 ubiquitin-protein ligase arih2 [Clydaea vesicula]|uniref:E3 ubiquitin-protein ligase arih2 n=1 Tax=Clydaea vesicula TaxID=447962 RepID=A0AAD5U475_9FUNG|nr:E3 ubiquitin-protein ligase arih2 [Clydaea vesicula]
MQIYSADLEQDYENLDYLYSRCSICFDEAHDFCLSRCRDQFCEGCFQRYVRETVKSSWGHATKLITCPVCNDVLTGPEWKCFLDDETIELYELYNQPYRAITRHCGECMIELKIAQKPIESPKERQSQFSEIYELISNLFKESKYKNKDSCLARFQADFCNEFSGGGNGSKSILDIYTNIMIGLGKLVGIRCSESGAFKEGAVLTLKPELLAKITLISTMFIPLETVESKWKKLQFLHISNFPKVLCPNCEDSLCFSCGESPFHENIGCSKYMKHIIIKNQDTEKVANFKWKLENSKRCPQCKIMINRDEGCNKVDCTYCGYIFCWSCEGKFENGNCSFYRCELDRTRSRVQKAEEKEKFSTSPSKTKAFTELGVPNIFQIEEKFLKY